MMIKTYQKSIKRVVVLDSNNKMLAKIAPVIYNMLYNQQSRKRQNHTAAMDWEEISFYIRD